jgi:hypothetical protein
MTGIIAETNHKTAAANHSQQILLVTARDCYARDGTTFDQCLGSGKAYLSCLRGALFWWCFLRGQVLLSPTWAKNGKA